MITRTIGERERKKSKKKKQTNKKTPKKHAADSGEEEEEEEEDGDGDEDDDAEEDCVFHNDKLNVSHWYCGYCQCHRDCFSLPRRPSSSHNNRQYSFILIILLYYVNVSIIISHVRCVLCSPCDTNESDYFFLYVGRLWTISLFLSARTIVDN